MIKFITRDLDGTLLQNGARTVDEDLFVLINELSQKNTLFVVTSERKYGKLRRLFRPVADQISYLIHKTEDYLIYIRDELMNEVQVIETLEEIEEEVFKISLYRPQGISSELKDNFVYQFQKQIKTAMAGSDWLDFTSLRTNKGEAIKVFQQYLSLLPDEMMGFGDQANDLEMLQTVGHSYAMINGIQEVKNASENQSENVIETLRELAIKGIL